MWLAEYCSGEMIRWVATVLDSVGANYFYHCRKLCWAMVFSRKQNRLKLSQAIEGENIKRFDRNSSDAFEAEHHWGSRSWAELRILRSLKTSSGGFQPGSRVADLSPTLKDGGVRGHYLGDAAQRAGLQSDLRLSLYLEGCQGEYDI